MKSYLISDKRDTLVGMRLAGIDGIVVHTPNEVHDAIKSAIMNDEIGILILTEQVADMVREEVSELKLRSKRPLIVEIPGRHGSIRPSDSMRDHIRDSVGIHI